MMDADAFAARLAAIEDRIEKACRRAGRARAEVTLVAVSKTFPLEAVEEARAAGLVDFGESRAQELKEKAERLPGRWQGGSVRWHMIGHLQRNKAKEVVALADTFHALDSLRLAEELDRRAAQASRTLPCFVQVNVSDEETKFGLTPHNTEAFLDQLADFDHLHVMGLMTLASPADDPEAVRPEFRRLRRLAEGYRGALGPLGALSMGMSGDFEVAIEEGATHVRVGSALFGSRA